MENLLSCLGVPIELIYQHNEENVASDTLDVKVEWNRGCTTARDTFILNESSPSIKQVTCKFHRANAAQGYRLLQQVLAKSPVVPFIVNRLTYPVTQRIECLEQLTSTLQQVNADQQTRIDDLEQQIFAQAQSLKQEESTRKKMDAEVSQLQQRNADQQGIIDKESKSLQEVITKINALGQKQESYETVITDQLRSLLREEQDTHQKMATEMSQLQQENAHQQKIIHQQEKSLQEIIPKINGLEQQIIAQAESLEKEENTHKTVWDGTIYQLDCFQGELTRYQERLTHLENNKGPQSKTDARWGSSTFSLLSPFRFSTPSSSSQRDFQEEDEVIISRSTTPSP